MLPVSLRVAISGNEWPIFWLWKQSKASEGEPNGVYIDRCLERMKNWEVRLREIVTDLRTQFVKKNKCYLTDMVRCDNVLCVDDSMELKAKVNGRRSVCIVENTGGWEDRFIEWMFETWLRGILDDINTAVCVNGRILNDNVNVWTENWAVKILAWQYRRLWFINSYVS